MRQLTPQEIKEIEADAKRLIPFGSAYKKETKYWTEGFVAGATRAKGLVEALELIIRKLRPCNDTVTNDIMNISEQALTNYKNTGI